MYCFISRKVSRRTTSLGTLVVIRKFVVFIVLLIVTLAGFGFWSVSLLREETQRRTHEQTVELLSKQVALVIDQRLQMLQALAKNQLILDAFRGGISFESPEVRLALQVANEVAHTGISTIFDSK